MFAPNQFPPDLIPMKQSSVKIDGQDRDVYLMGKVKVVKMGELEGDNWQVALGRSSTDTAHVTGWPSCEPGS